MKSIILLMATLFFSVHGLAQNLTTELQPQFDKPAYSLNIGSIFTNVIPKQAFGFDYKARPGMALGVLAKIPTSNSFVDYQTGLIYTRTKTKGTASFAGATSDVKIEMQRLSAPLYVKYYPNMKAKRFYFKGGAMANYFLKGKGSATTTTKAGGTSGFDSEFHKEDTFRTFVADAVMGVGYDLTVGPDADLDLELNYQRSLWGITKEGNDIMSEAFYLSMGIAL